MNIQSNLGYRPDAYPEMLMEFLYGGSTIKNVEVISSVRPEIEFHYFEASTSIRNYSCNYEACGGLAYDKKTLVACELKIEDEVCKRDLQPLFDQEGEFALNGQGFNPVKYPARVIDRYLSRVLEMQEMNNEILFWQGDTTLIGPPTPCGQLDLRVCDGYYRKFQNDPDVVDVAFPVNGFAVANIAATLDLLRNAMDVKYLKNPKARMTQRIMLPYEAYRSLEDFYAVTSGEYMGSLGPGSNVSGLTSTGLNDKGEHNFRWKNIPIIFLEGMLDETAVLTFADSSGGSNLVIGVDAMSDYAALDLLDMRGTTMEDKLRMKTTWRQGVGYKFGQHIIFMS